MEIWAGVLDKAPPNIRFSKRMEEIAPHEGIFTAHTNKASYATAGVDLLTPLLKKMGIQIDTRHGE